MTITIELSPGQEAQLRLKAHAGGKPIETYLQQAIETILNTDAFQHEAISVDDNDTLGKLIAACQIDTGIEDFAHQHDHYLHGTPHQESFD